MRNKKTLFIGIAIAVIVIIGVAIYMQSSGQLFQGSLIKSISTAPTATITSSEIEQRVMTLEAQTGTVEQKIMQLEAKASQLTAATNDNKNKIQLNLDKQNTVINYLAGYMIDDLCQRFEHNFADNNSCYIWLTNNLPTQTN